MKDEKAITEEMTISDLFWDTTNNKSLHESLETFRENYEREWGETDLTKRYTSTLPEKTQAWLLSKQPKRYFEGLPPFVQAFLKESMRQANEEGRLDDQPAGFIELYISGQMKANGWER